MSLNEEEKENINPYDVDTSGRRKRLTSGESMLPRIEDFSILKPISRGAFGKVFLGCKKTAPNKKYAIKVMKKEEMINKNMVNQVKAERDALALSKSPFVVHLYYSLQSKQNIYLVMEYMIGGDVKSLLAMYGYFDEEMAVVYIAEVTLALEYLHSHGIIHRDLKPDNMLISSEGHIKLTDFGLSKTTLDRDLHVRDIVNSPYIPRASNADYFRTPGQVLSLTSHLAFTLSSKKKVGNHSLLSSAGSFSSCASPLLAKSRKQLDLASPDSVQCTPPPVLSLTPTLRASLDWRNSTASEHSSIVGQIRRASRVSGLSAGSRRLSAVETDDSTFFHNDSDVVDCNTSVSGLLLESKVLRERKGSVSNEAIQFAKQSVRRRASEQVMTLGQILEASSPAAVMRRLSQPSVSTAGQSEQDKDKDKDTPHLFRSREMIQKSYAALHLKNMREGSFEDSDGSESSLPLESDDESSLNKPSDPNTTVESIEMQRHQQESSSSPGMLNLTNVTKLCFSPESSSDSEPITGGKKRPFRYVDKSPIFSGNSGHSSGLTMEISAVSLGDEHRLKRKSLSHLEVPQFVSSPASRASENTEPSSAVLSSSCYSDSCSSSQKSASPVPGRTWQRDDCTSSPTRDCSSESSNDEDDKANITVLSTCSSNCNENDCSDGEKLMEARPDCAESGGKELDRYITRMDATQSRRRTISNSSESSKGPSLRSSCPELDMSVHNLSLEEQSGDGGEEHRSPSAERLRHDSRSGTDNESSASKTKRGRRRSSSLQDLKKAQKELEESEAAKGSIEKPRTKFAGVKKVTRFMSLPSSMSSGTSGIQTPKMSKLCHMTPMITPGRVPQTPFRTPKSVRRGPAQTETERILGTPDYLAPELLLRKEHGVAVDWWALGVCLYEFLTGIPPFNDQTPESVFQNILTRDIPWPEDEEALSGEAHQAIESLLSFDPESRPTAAVLKEHPLLKTLDWENLHQLTPPFVPNPDDDSDTSYFDARNSLHHLQVSGIDF